MNELADSRSFRRIVGMLTIVLLMAVSIPGTQAQSISCQELYEVVVNEYDSRDRVSCYGSSMLAKATYYRLEGMGFVVGHLKSNEWDLSGKPYIFCGISSYRWRQFKSEGMMGSWGKAFHKYIMDYTCDCY